MKVRYLKMATKKYTTEQWITERIKYYWERKKTYELSKRSFDDDKYEFNTEMDKYFDVVADDDGKFTINLDGMYKGVKKLVCQRISQIKVEFNISKLDKILTKEQRRKVIQKHYQVNNWSALLTLLKDSGVDWKQFTKYVDITESVRDSVLEQMVELGELNADDVKKCSSAKIRTQYYKLTEK